MAIIEQYQNKIWILKLLHLESQQARACLLVGGPPALLAYIWGELYIFNIPIFERIKHTSLLRKVYLADKIFRTYTYKISFLKNRDSSRS